MAVETPTVSQALVLSLGGLSFLLPTESVLGPSSKETGGSTWKKTPAYPPVPANWQVCRRSLWRLLLPDPEWQLIAAVSEWVVLLC